MTTHEVIQQLLRKYKQRVIDIQLSKSTMLYFIINSPNRVFSVKKNFNEEKNIKFSIRDVHIYIIYTRQYILIKYSQLTFNTNIKQMLYHYIVFIYRYRAEFQ